ncbi:spermidine synthase [Rubripirellula tenax]|uniref:Spermidine synthase n=2 Tax=Rubripirellula tenax TaxID=2528015 RepID=A0A5C6FF22_9BACT|nr:spermidine synthase [Rubripirellula tenax]
MSIEILAYEETPLGVLCLRRRELVSQPGIEVTEVTLNHEFLMSSHLTDSERALTNRGLARLDANAVGGTESDLSVLVGGLGLGYTAAEAVKSDRVAKIEVVEFLPQVIGWLRDGLIPLASELNETEKLTLTHGDIYQRLARPRDKRFDLIVIDVDHSPQDVLGEESCGFYTAEGLTRAKSHLKPGGVLGVWSYAEDTPLLTQMKGVFCDVEVEQVTVLNDLIDVEQTDWLFYGRRPK